MTTYAAWSRAPARPRRWPALFSHNVIAPHALPRAPEQPRTNAARWQVVAQLRRANASQPASHPANHGQERPLFVFSDDFSEFSSSFGNNLAFPTIFERRFSYQKKWFRNMPGRWVAPACRFCTAQAKSSEKRIFCHSMPFRTEGSTFSYGNRRRQPLTGERSFTILS